MPSLPLSDKRFAIFAKIDRLASVIDSSTVWPLAVFLAAYLPLTVLIARRKLIWDDEFFTLYLSRPNSLSGILKALNTGADQHPPPFYFLIHQITAVLGPSHLTLRLASIVGYGLFCVCLFYLLRARTSVLWATVGMLIPLAANAAYYYASEARGYSLMLGFCALALLSWQNAAEAKRRVVWLSTLFVALMMAVSSHYYAILFLIPLGLGELTRIYILKRIDVLVWVAFFGAAVPPIAFLSTIRHASHYSTHFWAIPYWHKVLQFYPTFLGGSATIFLLGGLLYLFTRPPLVPYPIDDPEASASPFGFLPWEAVSWVAIAAIPIIAMTLAKLITHGYIERYALPGLIGAILIICHAGFHLARRSRIIPFLLALICLLIIGVQGALTLLTESLSLPGLIQNVSFLASYSGEPVVLSDATVFYQASFYAPRQLARKAVYLSDPAKSAKYLNQDTGDRGMLDLRPWFPLNVVEYASYVAEHSQFLVYGLVGEWNWMTYVVTPPAYRTELLARSGARLFLRVQKAGAISEPPQPVPHQPDSNYLFNHIRTAGPSLCEEWFPGDSFCTTIEQKLREH